MNKLKLLRDCFVIICFFFLVSMLILGNADRQECITAIELAPEGTCYRARTRFSRFYNLPELMVMFREVADIKTADQLHLPTPIAHYETIAVKSSELQQEMVQSLSERAAKIHSGSVDPSIDNMLKITSDGRKLGLDQRLINPMVPDDPGRKSNLTILLRK